MALPFADALRAVLTEVDRVAVERTLSLEEVALADALGRTLGVDLKADRDQPPFDRSTRDGFAVRAADVAGADATPARLAVIGEAPAGRPFGGTVGPGQCVEIMTGAPLPAGADAVVMVEHTTRPAPGEVLVARRVAAGEHVVPRGSELAAGAVALPAGALLDPGAIGLLASLGAARPRVTARPRVAILGTGDEIVPVDARPAQAEIRDSNGAALAAQVLRAGGTPVRLGVAKDDPAAIRARLEAGIGGADLLLVSGGVSMGKHDHVEGALAELGARVVFDAVAIRPGKPLVFGLVGGIPFFGLPGNPLSTFVTFELFVRPALARLSGRPAAGPRFLAARLAEEHRQKSLPLTAFVPAAYAEGAPGAPSLRVLPSQGSGDLGAAARADGYLVVEPGTTAVPAGGLVAFLPK